LAIQLAPILRLHKITKGRTGAFQEKWVTEETKEWIMNTILRVYKALFLFCLFCGVLYHTTTAQIDPCFSDFLNKDKITLVITDSGLGGLSVMENISQKMKKWGYFKTVNLIFVNALFDAKTGYNTLQSREEKIRMFNNVLNGIDNKYHPDAILIACNTLSVISPETEYVKKTKIPVLGIVESGTRLMYEKLNSNPNSSVVILGTETTIAEDSHRKALVEGGIKKERVITKACPQLQAYIEQNPNSEETEMLISVYLNEALDGVSKENPVYISLNCSHFGYSEQLWQKALRDAGYSKGEILNPNLIMGDAILPEQNKNRFTYPIVSFQVVSKVELINVKAMYQVFQKTSPELANAIENYRLIPDLFTNN
jgi:glutamate racemase